MMIICGKRKRQRGDHIIIIILKHFKHNIIIMTISLSLSFSWPKASYSLFIGTAIAPTMVPLELWPNKAWGAWASPRGLDSRASLYKILRDRSHLYNGILQILHILQVYASYSDAWMEVPFQFQSRCHSTNKGAPSEQGGEIDPWGTTHWACSQNEPKWDYVVIFISIRSISN